MALLEALTGAALITGVFRKAAAIAVSSLTVLFTILTFFIWRANPDFDCGCFGEVVHLSHLQTFLKNIVLLALCAIAFLPWRTIGKGKGHKVVAFFLVAAALLALCIHSLLYVPLVEFTPFKYSSRLSAASDEAVEQPVLTYIYQKNGQEGIFTLDRLPDSTWTFVRTEERLKQNSLDTKYHPDLSIRNMKGEYCDSVAIKDRVLAISVYNPSKLDTQKWDAIAQTLSRAADNGFTPMLILASSPEKASSDIGGSASLKEQMLSCAYFSDYKTVISFNRSNGGATYINDGNIIEKWGRRALPKAKELGKLARKDETDAMIGASTKGRLTFQAFLLYSFAVMMLV